MSESILLAYSDAIGEFGIVAGFTGVSDSGVADIVGCSSVLHIPWLFLEGLPDPVVMFMLVTSLLISLCDAILFADVHCWVQYYTKKDKVKLGSIKNSSSF